MKPTPKLRFVEREIFVPFQDYKDVVQPKTVRILQQWWEGKTWNSDKDQILDGEWRDVPLEAE
jgi:hypothetical protein